MVIKISGTNGSGKSSLVRALMAMWDFQPRCLNERKRPQAYEAQIKRVERLSKYFRRVIVLGSYATPCGGMDAISDHKFRMALITRHMDDPNALVVFESVLDGTTFGAIGELSNRCKAPWVYAMMSTPYEVCVDRVTQRRRAKGNDSPFDGERSLRPKIRSSQRVLERAANMGHATWLVDWRQTPAKAANSLIERVEELAKEKGGLCY